MEGILGVTAVELLMLAAAAFAGAVVGGVSGFGAGVVAAPLLLPIVGVKAVMPVLAVALMIGGFSRAWVFRAALVPRMIPRILLPLLPGVMIGVLIYDLLPPAPLSIFVGTLLILSIALRHVLKARAITPSPAGVVAASFGTGVVTGGAPGGGIVIASLLLGLGLDGAALVGTDAVIGMTVNVVRASLFGTLGLLTTELLLLGLALGVTMIPGAYFARWLVQRMKPTWHVALIEAFVLFGGATFLYRGVVN